MFICCFEREEATFLTYDGTAAMFVYAAAIQITAFTEETPNCV